MAKKRMGWEKLLYYGAAGSTAATHVDANVTDIEVKVDWDYAETPDRGDGTKVPEMTKEPVGVATEVSFKMIYKDGDANVAAFLAASRNNPKTAKAIKVVRYTGGDTEVNGDYYIDDEAAGALKDGQEITFTCHPTDSAGRKPIIA